MQKFMIGNTAVYGRLVCKPSQLSEIQEKDFFKQIEISLKRNDLRKYGEMAIKKEWLKQGVTIGDNYFLIQNKP